MTINHFTPGVHDLILITLDTLRFDVAAQALADGRTPFLASVLPGGAWEARHTPASFTFAAHHSFFAGFLPTPILPGPHPRPFAMRFSGSATTGPETCVLDAADLPEGLGRLGYRTVCIGGTGFFNRQNPLGCALPDRFQASHWSPAFGVTDPDSTAHQIDLAARLLAETAPRMFLFINVSAIHQPNRHYLPGAQEDSLESHAAALCYVDGQLPRLFDAIRRRAPALVILCSDHGTLYGEDGYTGHRVGHPIVWTVPYAEFFVERA